MSNSVLKLFKTIFIIVFYFLFDSLIIYLLKYLGINLNSLSTTTKIILQITIDLLLMFILYLIYHKDINHDFKDYLTNYKTYFKFGFKWWVIGLIIMFVSNTILTTIYEVGASNETIVREAISKLPLYMLFSSCIYAPFVEEIVFRKNLRELFSNNLLFIISSFLLFGFVHITTSTSPLELLYIIPYGTFGAVFAYMYSKTNNIFLSINFHMIHNFISVFSYILLYFLGGNL